VRQARYALSKHNTLTDIQQINADALNVQAEDRVFLSQNSQES